MQHRQQQQQQQQQANNFGHDFVLGFQSRSASTQLAFMRAFLHPANTSRSFYCIY